MIMKKICEAILGIIGFLAIASACVIITLHAKPLYHCDIDALAIEETSGYSREEILLNYDVLIKYNSISGPDTLEFPTLAMSDGGRQHFAEVKDIFIALEYFAIIALPIFAVLAIIAAKGGRYIPLRAAGICGIAVPAVLGIGAALFWDKFFVLFHKIAFDNDFWIFSPSTDPVIKILPDQFFFHCAVMIAVLCVAISIVLLIISNKIKSSAE